MANYGDGLDIATGIFTAPVNGVYTFAMTALKHVAGSGCIRIRKNGQTAMRPYITVVNTQLTYVWYFDLTAGDTVNLQLTDGDFWASKSNPHPVHFSGRLI